MPRNRINALLMIVIIVNSCALVGCHRSYYRRQADMEASRLIREKATDPRWNSADGSIDIDPQSRMFNPFSADHPPIPPDDRTSHQFMHHVDRKEGYPHWHSNGDTSYVENPVWMSYLPINEKGQVVLNLERAYQLALIHSPDLQEQRETLYLSALDVSLERFGFDSQLFSGFNSFFTTEGRLRNGGNSSSTLSNQLGVNGGGINLQRMGITGATFAAGLANTVLFNFSGNNTQSATSLIDFSLIQPLLLGAGRDRILEGLTQSERTLLANVRQLERFRRGFYLQIATGRNPGPGPNAAGNFPTPGFANFNAGGFFGLLEAQQQIRNQEFNVRQLEAVLDQFREFFRRERLDAIQLKLFEGNVYRQQRSLLDAKTNYQAALDDFKILLGLPPTIDVVIEDPFLDRFELISDEVNERMISISNLRKRTGVGLNEIYQIFEGIGDDVQWPDFEWPEDLSQSIGKLTPFIESAEATLETIVNQDRKLLEADLDKLEAKRPARIEYLKKVKRAIDAGEIISSVDPRLFESSSVASAEALRKLLSDPEVDAQEYVIIDGKKELAPRSILKRAEILRQELLDVKTKIAEFEEVQESKSKKAKVLEGTESDPVYNDPELYEFIVAEFQEKIPGQLSELNNLALELSLLQALARSNTIEINDVDLSGEQAIRIARCMRRDLMNARASLVDQWRNIEFVADQLEAQVDLVFTGEIGNAGDNPFKLRADNGELSGGFQFDAPIVRLSERNDYREALIDYQQARRSFYQFEDNLNVNLRDVLRNINRSKVLFELDRLTVQVDIQNVEINRFELDAPVSVNAAGGDNRLGTVTSRNLTDAIINLNGSQDSFLESWVEFEVLRRNLDFDLGTMQLDQNGAWIDPGFIDAGIATRAANMMGVQLDCQFCENVEVSHVETFEAEHGNAVYGQPVPADNQAQPFNYQNNEALPQQELQPGADDVLIDPTDPVIPNSGNGGGSGSRLAPQSLFKPVKAAKATSVARSKPESVIKQHHQLAPRMPITNSLVLKNLEDKPSLAEDPIVAANSIRHAVIPDRADNAEPAEQLARSGFGSSSAIKKTITSPPIVLEIEPPSDVSSVTIPAARQVLAAAQSESLDSKKHLNLHPVATESKMAEPLEMAEPLRTADSSEMTDAFKSFKPAVSLKTTFGPTADQPIVIRAIPKSASQVPSGETVKASHWRDSDRPTIGASPTDWKKQPSSLGGLLNRFGTNQSQSK